jgi:predicted phage terminase large subunit-like protein
MSDLKQGAQPEKLSAQAKKELASRILAKRRLIHFTKRLNPAYLPGWVHEDICERLERFSDDVIAGLSPRLMLLMPPRHGKSELASRNFPAWHMGRAPNHEFIASSYNVDLARSFSRKVQAIVSDPRYPFDVRLDPANQSAETWGLVLNGLVTPGGYVAAGVGGGITGKGAHVLLIDDPIKNAEEADSLTTREALWNWYTSTAYTRLAPGGGVLVIQTCWHDDDLAGRLQQVMASNPDDPDTDQFEIIKYPAIAEADEWRDNVTREIIYVTSEEKVDREDVIERLPEVRAKAALRAEGKVDVSKHTLLRAKGEPLHAERYDLRKLLRIMRTLSSRFWSALYQQNPVPEDGSFFLKDQFGRASPPPPGVCYGYITADFAITEKKQNDYTVIRGAYVDEYDFLHMVHLTRMKSGDAFAIVEAIITMMKKMRGTIALRAGFEKGQIFLALEALLKKRMKEEKLYIPYEYLTPTTDKLARASPLQGRMQQGRVSFDVNAEWFPVVQQEYLRFPNGVNDDIVDADAWMARLVENHAAPRPPKPKSEKSWKDKLNKIARSGHGGSPMKA